ncbi:Uncharacterized protein HZ326_25163 [Fusarium oxysporum f. sp. albedinis]|nr:Uncharacterized protein HZ326_25163 [Fusarium oxysporum f. sp. albedinis]
MRLNLDPFLPFLAPTPKAGVRISRPCLSRGSATDWMLYEVADTVTWNVQGGLKGETIFEMDLLYSRRPHRCQPM